LECLSLCWHAPLRRDHLDYCNAEVGNPGGTYELHCMFVFSQTKQKKNLLPAWNRSRFPDRIASCLVTIRIY
jgi:hypothetical protein